MQAKLQADQKLLAEHTAELPDGRKILTEIISQGEQGVLVGSFIIEDSGPRLLSWCGYCDGRLIGCVSCPNNDPFLNCVTGTISCRS